MGSIGQVRNQLTKLLDESTKDRGNTGYLKFLTYDPSDEKQATKAKRVLARWHDINRKRARRGLPPNIHFIIMPYTDAEKGQWSWQLNVRPKQAAHQGPGGKHDQEPRRDIGHQKMLGWLRQTRSEPTIAKHDSGNSGMMERRDHSVRETEATA